MKIVVTSHFKTQYDYFKKLGLPVLYDKPLLNKFSTQTPEDYGQNLVNDYIKQSSPKYKNVFFTAFASFIAYRGRPIPKPRFKMDALEYILQLSGHMFSLVTWYALKNQRYHEISLGMAETKITLKSLTQEQATNYVNDYDVVNLPFLIDILDPFTQTLIDNVSGSLNNLLYQLPLESLDLEKIRKGVL